MGWVKSEIESTEKIFNDVIKKIPIWKGIPNDSSSPCEFFTDYLRDNYELTLQQCDELCESLKSFYKIDKFYAGEMR